MQGLCPKCGYVTEPGQDYGHVPGRRCGNCGWVGPVCFGVNNDPTDVKCTGGQDPMFWSAHRQHGRPACKHYEACKHNKESMNAVARQTVEFQGQQPLAPMPQLPGMTQQPAQQKQLPQLPVVQVAPPPVQIPVAQPQYQPVSMQQALQAPRPPAYLPPQQQVIRPPQPMAPPMYQPQPYGYAPPMMPGYHASAHSALAVPEPNYGSVWQTLFWSAVRGLGYGAFSQMAYVFSTAPFGAPPPQPMQMPPPQP